MTHDHAGPDCPACKKIINNYIFIANLAPLINTTAAASLADAARAFKAIADGMGIKPDLSQFEGCEQGRLLAGWLRDDSPGDAVLMNQWTDDIYDAIAELATGNPPK